MRFHKRGAIIYIPALHFAHAGQYAVLRMGIEITLMNQSYDASYTVVIVLPNTRTAWKVLSSPAYSHTFRLPAGTDNGFWVGVTGPVTAGTELSEALLSRFSFIATENHKKANLIMTGGSTRAPYLFTLLPR